MIAQQGDEDQKSPALPGTRVVIYALARAMNDALTVWVFLLAVITGGHSALEYCLDGPRESPGTALTTSG